MKKDNERKILRLLRNMEETTDKIFEVQDIIGINITKALQVDATEGKIATDWLKEFVDFETYTYALNWRHEILKFTPDGYTNSEKYYELLKNNIPKNVQD